MEELVLDGKALECKAQDNGWVFCFWKTNKSGFLPVSFCRDWHKIEKIIGERKLKGWYCNSESEHKEMHKILERMGAKNIGQEINNELFWFFKEINHVQ